MSLLCAWAVGSGACYGQRADESSARQADESIAKPDLSRVEKQIIAATNAFRGQMNRAELRVNKELTKTAEDFARYMAETDKYGHTADGQEPWERAKKHGYDYCIVEENIAYQFSSGGFTTEKLADNFFKGWKESPGHRKNMLNPDVVETAVAIARGEKSGKYYAVQLFGRPKSEAITFSITNRTAADIKYTVDGENFTLKPRFTQTHETCTPAKVTFPDAGGESGSVKEYRPHAGTRFEVHSDGAQRLIVESR